ncbi:MAG: hypothetical protein HQL68_00795 [Magnetococcales bacterium]|nr:hypothetical protein [Magnetococcales bacterium]
MKDALLDLRAVFAYKIILFGIKLSPNGHFKDTMLLTYFRAISTEAEFLDKMRKFDN